MEENKITKSGRIPRQIWAIVSKLIFLNMNKKGWSKDGALDGSSLQLYFLQLVLIR